MGTMIKKLVFLAEMREVTLVKGCNRRDILRYSRHITPYTICFFHFERVCLYSTKRLLHLMINQCRVYSPLVGGRSRCPQAQGSPVPSSGHCSVQLSPLLQSGHNLSGAINSTVTLSSSIENKFIDYYCTSLRIRKLLSTIDYLNYQLI